METQPTKGKSDLDPRYTCFPQKGSEFESKVKANGMVITPETFPQIPEKNDDIHVAPPHTKFDPVQPPDVDAAPSIQKPPNEIHSPTDSS